MELYDIYIIAGSVIGGAALFLLAGYATRVKSPKWRILYSVPMTLCLILMAIGGTDSRMLPAYIAAVLPVIGFIKEDKRLRQGVCAAAVVLSLCAAPLCECIPGYRAVDYTEDFEKAFTQMKGHYVLAEYKGIDWDKLHDKYLAQFRGAEDDVDAFIIWKKYCAEFYDGHVGYIPDGVYSAEDQEQIYEQAYERIGAYDYGLSLITLSDGIIAAVNVDESLNALGISNGTIITAWNGGDIRKTAYGSPLLELYGYADKDNEYFYLPAYAACVGGESAEVSFLTDSGEETSAALPKLGSYYRRHKGALDVIDRSTAAANFAWAEVSSDAVCLVLKSMEFDSNSSHTDNYDNMKYELIRGCSEWQEAGKTKLIIDARNNGGGSGTLVKAIAEIFAPEGEHFYCCDGVWDEKTNAYTPAKPDGSYEVSDRNTFFGENHWQGEIILLVNANSVSAADHLTMILRGLANITVMGLTEPNGSAQGVSLCQMEHGNVCFSCSRVLNEDGTVFVDSGTDRESGNDIDIRIPLDAAAVRAMFDEDRDYVMEFALGY